VTVPSDVKEFRGQLEQTEHGRRTLKLVGDLARARLAEEVAEVGLNDAEHEVDRWRAEYQRHRAERGRLEGEIQHLAGYL